MSANASNASGNPRGRGGRGNKLSKNSHIAQNAASAANSGNSGNIGNSSNSANNASAQNTLHGLNPPSHKSFVESEISDTGLPATDRSDDNNSTIDNDERNTLIQVLHSYEDFQKKNMHYGKVNPYRKRESQLSKMKKTIVKLFTISDIRLDESDPNKNVDSSTYGNSVSKKRRNKAQGSNFLTSRAAMWNEVEKNDDPEYDLKLESSKNKSIRDIVTHYLSVLINDTINDKKGMTYIAILMIILSVLITCISGVITLFSNSTGEKYNFNLHTTKNNYDDINKFMNYIKLGNEENNRSDMLRLYELLEEFKTSMNQNMNENKNTILINKKENHALYELNANLENKLKELEKKLLVNTKDIDYFKIHSKKEVENFKKILQENYESFQNKLKDYVKTVDTIKKDIHKKNSLINDVEKKMNKSQMDIKKDVSDRVENEKRGLLNTISELQKKIQWIESKLVFHGSNSHDSLEFDSAAQGGLTHENDGGEARERQIEQRINMWNEQHADLMQDIQKELELLKESAKKSTNFLDDVFPTFEHKILKNVENKIKYYLEMYKKDIINEITESKVIYNEEKYKTMTMKQEKMQSELLKTISSQIKAQTKIIKDDLSKSLHTMVDQKQIKIDSDYPIKSTKVNYDSLDMLQKKVDELYNEFILDYNEIDWALESLGARIVYKMTSSPLNRNDFIEKFLNQIASFLPSEEIYGMIKPMGKDPSIILKPSNFPGDCFSFNGSKGKITIHLPATIDVSSISIQHVHENISNNSNATPKYFSVYGVVDSNWPEHFESQDINYDDFKNSSLYSCLHSVYGNLQPKEILDKWLKGNKNPGLVHLGDFYFDRKKRISTYPTKHCFPVKRITFEFTENYGAPYTCVYRLKVHGKRCIRKFK
ncbi:nuclear protein [Plasmodium cynomolgi strain B]|uniref:Nuclear protein n=1 Tax=Plasmodium cynomolgi (strain B) TaxID=1120755 RepID=K6UMY1_PLACD|nr:nuclear protein [Plasmodium cynomolgi strain B]GAB68988.1 nuclear protein [Plasmodium cynomolgi strain B]